jgi:hypothetical protein
MTSTEELAVVEQLNKLETAKVAIRNAIIRKHVTVGASTPFEKYADAIDLIDSGIGGTYGKTKALFPLPPEGNFGGGINQKLAWKLGEVATLIRGEDDYPDEPTFIIDSDAAFSEWINFNAHGQITASNDYTTILLKKKDDNKNYILPHTIDLDQMKTERVFAENGVILEWDAESTTNISTSDPLRAYHSRFAIQKSSVSISDRCYVQNLVIKCTKASSKAIKNVYLIRGIEVQNNGTLSIGDLFYGYRILSRVLVETYGYVNTSSSTLTWADNLTDTRTGAVIEVASGANILDVTIINKNPGAACISGFEGASSGKLTRCYLLGVYNKGINVSNDQGSLVDRCYIQKIITTIANTAGINAGAIINSFIDTHESNLVYSTAMALDQYISATFKAHTKIDGCKVNTVQGPRIVAFLSATDVINCAVINFIIDGSALPITPVKIIQAIRYVTGNAIFRVSTKVAYQYSAFTFTAIEGSTSATIKDNIIGDVMLSSGSNANGNYSFTVELIKNANLIEGNQLNNFEVYLSAENYINYNSYIINGLTISLCSGAALVRNNFLRNIFINRVNLVYSSDVKTIINLISGLNEVSGNVIDSVVINDNAALLTNIIGGTATLIKENRIGSIKVTDFGYNNGVYFYNYWNHEINVIASAVANVKITQNAIDSLIFHTHNGQRTGTILRGIYTTAAAEITKNLIGKIKTAGTEQYGSLACYGIFFGGTVGSIIENDLKIDNLIAIGNGNNVASIETSTGNGSSSGIYIGGNNVEISKNIVEIVSSVGATYGLQSANSTVPTGETKNQKNKLSVVTIGESLTGYLASTIYNLNDTEIIQDKLPNITTWYNACYSGKKADAAAKAEISGNNEIRGNEIDTTI